MMVWLGGFAALSWELLWQLKASLTLGVSAFGTAVVLASTMGGMTLGALAAGRVLERFPPKRPLLVYGVLELVIGVSGLCMTSGFRLLEWADSWLFATSPGLAAIGQILGIPCVLCLPTLAMGATFPLFGSITKNDRISVPYLYALNTGGAAMGVLTMAFGVISFLGVSSTVRLLAATNCIVAVLAMTRRAPEDNLFSTNKDVARDAPDTHELSWNEKLCVVLGTGFATFALEVAWFRALRAAFLNTTKSFSVVLASVLIAIAISAHLAPRLRRRAYSLPLLLTLASIAILLATPLVERIDLISGMLVSVSYFGTVFTWFGLSFVTLGPAILLLGIALPWLIDEVSEPRQLGRLYATNTAGAIIGSLSTAWLLLPWLGFARTSWLVGGFVGALALTCVSASHRRFAVPAIAVALAVAVATESGLGRRRVQGKSTSFQVVAYDEGPDSTVSVIEMRTGKRTRELIIDGCAAASEHEASKYMRWMGTLPMLAHHNPRHCLVICFGTGQTANAVRLERPLRLDVVELSSAVLRMADYFPSNEGVLRDERVRSIVMDGRAWLRRRSETYDVVTLEPMPPHFASSNALYSREFYQLIAARLNDRGVVAQWVPFHMLPPFFAASISRTFTETFPDCLLWIDPQTGTGILLGRHMAPSATWTWPGLDNHRSSPSVESAVLLDAVALTHAQLKRYSELGATITDDNQLLSYGAVWRRMFEIGPQAAVLNLAILDQIATNEGTSPIPPTAPP